MGCAGGAYVVENEELFGGGGEGFGCLLWRTGGFKKKLVGE